ncbi:peptidoglycan DD-metalloendopeptidase family protein [Streptomyces sp. 796.1]|uniref:M23 family metallopeptidase n=1 Tax=Streptomyces sp. 796.1 TaxID=3163029 RepID=UPI0039C9EA7A
MNNRHPSGSPDPAAPTPDASSAHYGSYDQQGAQHGHSGYDGFATGTFDQLGSGYGQADAIGDPSYGTHGGYDGVTPHASPLSDNGAVTGYDGSYDAPSSPAPSSGSYDSGQWDFTGVAYDGQSAGYDTGSYDTTGGWDGATGYPQQSDDSFAQVASGSADASGQWDTGAWESAAQTDTGQFATGSYGTGQFAAGQFDTAQADGGQFDTGAFDRAPFADPSYDTGQFDAGQFGTGRFDATGQFDTGQWNTAAFDDGRHEGGQFDTGQYGTVQWDTGSFQIGDAAGEAPLGAAAEHPGEQAADALDPYEDPTGWDTGAFATTAAGDPDPYGADSDPYGSPFPQAQPGEAHGRHEQAYDAAPEAEPERTASMPVLSESDLDDPADDGAYDADSTHSAGPSAGSPAESGTRVGRRRQQADAVAGTAPPARRDGNRGRRRPSARSRRSALLTVAVPSVAVMGVAAVAAASVSGVGGDGDDKKTDKAAQAVPDRPQVQPTAANSKLDTQLAGLTEKADNFANRASRTQERIDLKERQAAERKRKIAEAARKEAMRPKFSLPVQQHGLSAMYGQAGLNWMSLHTGIDFPVDGGTPVMAATDGTVRTQFNTAYGNMAIVTSPDGTETWYCHLSSTKLRSGTVQAGDTIAYSGDSGNSTGPHLHFEVRPGGGSAVDPLTWLRGHGLDPT